VNLLNSKKCPWEHCGGMLYCEPMLTPSGSYSERQGYEIRCHYGHLIPVIRKKNGEYDIDEKYLEQMKNERGIKIDAIKKC
jgi:hypothetical protein